MRTLEQERSNFAYNAVLRVKKVDKDVQKKYSSYVKSAPILILTNGLAQTLVFYLSKMRLKIDTEYKAVGEIVERYERGQEKLSADKIAYAYLYYQILEWLAGKSNGGKGLTRNKDPLKFIMEDADVAMVIQLTKEVINLLNWMKRFADAMLEKEEE